MDERTDDERRSVQALELKHLRCLAAIIDTGTFTDAAHELASIVHESSLVR
nr:hypothetical protein [Streptomyces laculatispora]